ncbi:MAG TPA: VWA domain-containing protein [Thermoleophilaceae bacterium]|nr:VWA domain-containing protein [Thermoleophilaceae bacterium]
MSDGLTGRLGLLCAACRAGGVRIGVGELLAAHRALRAIDASDRRESYLALRAVLCSRREDVEAFDAAFVEAFAGRGEYPEQPDVLDDIADLVLPSVAVPPQQRVAPPSTIEESELMPAAWSDTELLREKDFAEFTAADRRMARGVMARLAAHGPVRTSRRTRASHRTGPRPRGGRADLRGTVRSSLRYGGMPVERHWREPRQRPRPVVLVCDVSGSMEPYARMLLMYMQACVAARRRVEAFAFGTQLTRVTGELAGRDPERALDRAAHAMSDWSGGTRIGDAIATLNREHGGRVGRGAVVVVLSDGWDRGEPEQLSAEMARLSRTAHRLVWLNPLKAAADYEPLTRGMVASLPHVDRFLAGNTIASLEELAVLMQGGKL